MQANKSVSAPRRGLLGASTASCVRYARFTVADRAGRVDPDFKPPGIREISAKTSALHLSSGAAPRTVRRAAAEQMSRALPIEDRDRGTTVP
jgi:hypothetical protein